MKMVSPLAVQTKSDRFRGSPYSHSLASTVYRMNPKASGKEVAALADFFRMFLQIDPNDRGSLEEISSHRWLVHK